MQIGPQFVYSGRSEGLVSHISKRLRVGSSNAGTVRWTEVIPGVRWEGSAEGRQFFVITAEERPEGGRVFTLTHRPDRRSGLIDIRSHEPTSTQIEAVALADSLATVELARRRH